MPQPPNSMTQEDRTECMMKLCEVATKTGQAMLDDPPVRITDTVQKDGHQFSTVDDAAKSKMRQNAQAYLSGYYEQILEESDITVGKIDDNSVIYRLLVADAVEGSTNAKRGLGNIGKRPILAGTSLMLLEGPKMSSIAATAFFDWSTGHCYSSVRGEPGSFIAFMDGQLMTPSSIPKKTCDSQIYVAVPGYSHTNITQRAMVETALLENGIRAVGGTRSSAQDLLDLLWGQTEAYVDLRPAFSQSTSNRDEVLRAWDVGALLPLLEALGFIVSDNKQTSWQENRFSDSLVLIAARTADLWQQILEIINGLPFLQDQSDGSATCLPIVPQTGTS
jgi:fructose-1,6-bisphosphatase/inositol monophosphatase family enzyme